MKTHAATILTLTAPAPPSFVQVIRKFARSAQSGPRDALHRDRRTPDFVYRLSYAPSMRFCSLAPEAQTAGACRARRENTQIPNNR